MNRVGALANSSASAVAGTFRPRYNSKMAERYRLPARETRVEIRVKNSRFIATAAPVGSVEEAKAFVARIKQEFGDASHNVPAFQVGHGASLIAHCSDDGEPAGTAGRPALAVLQGSGVGDIAVVVTRYFGGTKLGTGGLVRAYGDAVREVLSRLPLAEKVTTHTASLLAPYPLYEQVKLLINEWGGQILEETYAAEVTIIARFVAERFLAFQDALRELSHGRMAATIIATDENTIMPLPPSGDVV